MNSFFRAGYCQPNWMSMCSCEKPILASTLKSLSDMKFLICGWACDSIA